MGLSRRGLAVGAAAAVLVAGVGTWAAWPGSPAYGEQFPRPTTAYPAAPDIGPMHVAATATGPVTLSGSLAIVSRNSALTVTGWPAITGPTDGLAAVGRAYWTYRRAGHSVVGLTSDGGTDTLSVLWADGLLVRVDARKGKVAWHRDVGAAVAALAPQLWPTRTAGLLLLISGQRIDAVDARTGAVHWNAVQPSGTTLLKEWPAIGTRTLTVSDDRQLQTYDLRSGRRLWQRGDLDVLRPLQSGPDQVVPASAPGAIPVLDEDSGRQIRQISSTERIELDDIHNGVGYGTAREGGPEAISLSDGRVLWTVRLAAAQTLPGVLAARNGQVYAVITDDRPNHRLLFRTYDATTGLQHSSVEVPLIPPGIVSTSELPRFQKTGFGALSALTPSLAAIAEADSESAAAGLEDQLSDGYSTVILSL
ncbi:PQQ-binding-like beta-propeller repeat protein [Actinoallomurus sp. NPDC050550]|uniref:outer membrane protein assembly factor BamB family protein n=1 Tax=Actinoallomurus sp. NPDC050550 TaxID=3154937 RepID=UPI0033DFDE14